MIGGEVFSTAIIRRNPPIPKHPLRGNEIQTFVRTDTIAEQRL
jgi:hypothetical protein